MTAATIYNTANLFGNVVKNQVEFLVADCETSDELHDKFCFALVTMPQLGTLVFEAVNTNANDHNGFEWMVMANTIEEYRAILKNIYAKVSVYDKDVWTNELGFEYNGRSF